MSSVGPYRFSTIDCGAAACHASALARGSGSPQNRLQRRVGKTPGLSEPFFRISAAIDGTENQTVSCCRSAKRTGASRSSGCIAQTHAPFSHATNRSKTDRSNV